MIQAIAKPISLDEFLQLPETQPASEYVRGQVVRKPLSSDKSSRLRKTLLKKINSVLWTGEIAKAFPELRCSFGDQSFEAWPSQSFVPDIVVLRKENIPVEASGEVANAILTPPDWMIEIAPSEQGYRRATENILYSLDRGCQMGWLIEPEEKNVVVSPQDGRSRSFSQWGAVLPVPDWASGLELTVGELFGWLIEPPILKFAGVFEHDPDFAEVVAQMRAERKLDDENPAYTVSG